MKLKSRMNDNSSANLDKQTNELCQGLTLLGIEYDEHIIQKFRKYIDVLCEYKNRFHLLSHQDYIHISKRHFLTSLAALRYVTHCYNACDIGAGAGFPSIPLKILRPEVNFTLFESKKKKAKFLKHLICELDLSGIDIIDGRAEHFKEKKFDLILLKAVGKINRLIKIIDNLIEPKGCAVFYKSHQVEEEIRTANNELKKRGYRVEVEKVFTPIENLPLALVVLKKL